MFSYNNEETTFTDDILLGQSAFCLKAPEGEKEEIVVHREGGEDFVFLFESLDDAYDCASEAAQVLTFWPQVTRVRLSELNFAAARFKPASGVHVDIPLPRRR